MPRNGLGVMSWPPNTNGVPNTTVSSTRYNAFLADLLADLNAARPITSGGTGGTSAVSANDGLNTSGADMASAATLNLANATGVVVTVTGTTGITALGTVSSGAIRTLIFAGALTLTHNATSLILPGAANIITAAGDVAVFRSKGAGNWVCVGYQRANGGPTVNVLSSPAIAGNVVVTSTDASAIAGPTISLDRGSASAAAADDIGEVLFVGKDSAGNSQTYARIFGRIDDPANGAEDGQMRFQTVVAGVEATRAAIGGGLAMIGAAGGDPGAGKINATDLLINGNHGRICVCGQIVGQPAPVRRAGPKEDGVYPARLRRMELLANLIIDCRTQIACATSGTFVRNDCGRTSGCFFRGG